MNSRLIEGFNVANEDAVSLCRLIRYVKRECRVRDGSNDGARGIDRFSSRQPTMLDVEIIIRFNKNGSSAKQWTVARRTVKQRWW